MKYSYIINYKVFADRDAYGCPRPVFSIEKLKLETLLFSDIPKRVAIEHIKIVLHRKRILKIRARC